MGELQPQDDPLQPDRLVERYGERIFRIAWRMMGNDADAEDVTQTVLLKILRRGSSFRGDSDPMGWIYRITMNESREVYRRRSRRPTVGLDALPADFDRISAAAGVTDFSRRPDKDLYRREVEERVRGAIQELPDGYREAVILTDLEGLSYKGAAEAMDLTLGGFKTRLHRARLHLRARLEQFWRTIDEGSPPAGDGGGDRDGRA